MLLDQGWNGGSYEMNVMLNNSLQFGLDQDFTEVSLRDVVEKYVRLGLIQNMDNTDEIMSIAWTPGFRLGSMQRKGGSGGRGSSVRTEV